MRKFYFQNEKGERKSLNSPNGIMVKNPAGLGFTMKINQADSEDGFFSVTYRKQASKSIAFDLLFMNGYKDYKALVTWINSAESLYLVYIPYGAEEYMCSVSVSYMTKTELSSGGVLGVPVSLAVLTPWYSPVAYRVSMQEQSSHAMKFPFRYNSSLIYGANIAGRYAVEIQPNGHIPASISVRHSGQLVNPIIQLVGISSGKTYGKCEIETTITEGQTLEFSSFVTDTHLRVVNVDGTVTDLTDSINPAEDPFIRVPLNEPCRLSISSESDISGTVEVSVYYFYRSV